MTTITAIKALRLDSGFCLVRVDTDTGVTGYGECGYLDADVARAMILGQAAGGERLKHLSLIGKDPLDIGVHHHNMIYAYPQKGPFIPVLSGIDMALWDLAGKLLGQPVHKLLGGAFRSEIALYSHCPHFADPAEWPDQAAALKADPHGFTAYKVDINAPLRINMQEYVPSLSPADVRTVARYYEAARRHLGDDIDIIVHCHNELDLPSAVAVAEAIADIRPLYFEDPLQPGYSENWKRLRDSTNVPLLTGENLALPEAVLPFLQNTAIDCLQPDIILSGGITGTKAIADLAARYRIPITLHNVSGLLLNAASQQLAAAVFNCPRIECTRRATSLAWSTPNPLRIANGKMQISTAPGLGVTLDEDWLMAHLWPGETGWA